MAGAPLQRRASAYLERSAPTWSGQRPPGAVSVADNGRRGGREGGGAAESGGALPTPRLGTRWPEPPRTGRGARQRREQERRPFFPPPPPRPSGARPAPSSSTGSIQPFLLAAGRRGKKRGKPAGEDPRSSLPGEGDVPSKQLFFFFCVFLSKERSCENKDAGRQVLFKSMDKYLATRSSGDGKEKANTARAGFIVAAGWCCTVCPCKALERQAPHMGSGNNDFHKPQRVHWDGTSLFRPSLKQKSVLNVCINTRAHSCSVHSPAPG